VAGEELVGVGDFLLQRGACRLEERERLALLSRQRPVLETMAGCIQHTWPIILTGSSTNNKYFKILNAFNMELNTAWASLYDCSVPNCPNIKTTLFQVFNMTHFFWYSAIFLALHRYLFEVPIGTGLYEYG
jgi:hypothetical protein